MSRLDNCLGKVSKLINKSDAALLKKEAAALEAEGMKPIQAASKATQDALEDVNKIYKNTLKAASKAAPNTLPAIKAYWEGKPLVVNELPASHKKLAKELFDQGIKTEADIAKALGEENAKWAKPFANHIAQNETLFQASKGQVNFSSVGKAIITIFESGDASTVFHELLHLVRLTLLNGEVAGVTKSMLADSNKFVGAKDNKWTREQEEKFTRAGERYLREGINTGVKAVDDFLGVLTGLMRSIYTTVTGSDIDVELTPEIRAVFDQLFTRGEILREQGVEPTRVQGELNIEAASTKPKPKPKLPALKRPTGNTDDFGVRRSITDAIKKEYDLPDSKKFVGKTDQEAWDEALMQVARADAYNKASSEQQAKMPKPPLVGEALIQDLNEDPRPATKVEEALLAHEGLVRDKAVVKALLAVEKMDSKTSDVRRRNLDGNLNEAVAQLEQLINLVQKKGSQAGLALQGIKLVVSRKFELSRMLASELSWRNANAATRQKLSPETIKEITKLHAEIQAVEKKNAEAAESIKTEVAEKERLQVENLLLKEQLAASKKPRTASVRKSTTDRVAERVLTARERLAALGYGSRTFQQGKKGQIEFEGGSTLYQDGNTLEPEALEAFSEIAADLMLKGMNESQVISELGNEFQEVIVDHDTEILAAARQLLNKLAKSSSKKSPQELASLIDPNKDLSRQMVYNMYRGFLEKTELRGADVVNEILKLINPTMPHITFNDVVDAFTGYGKIKFPSSEKLSVLVRQEKRLRLLNRQLGEVREKRLYKLTGLQRDRLDPNDPIDQEIRKLTEERNQLMRDMKLTEDSADKTLARGTLSSIKTHLKNDLADLQKAIDMRTELVKKEKRAPDTDPELLELRAQKKAKRAEYNAVFGINTRQLSQEQRLKAADKALDKSLVREEKMALEGILKRPAGTPQIKTPAMVAKAAKIKAFQDARHAETRRLAKEAKELLNPPKTPDQKNTATLEKQVQNAINRFEHFLKHGKLPDSETGPVTYSRETFPTELFKIKNELAEAVAYLRADKRKQSALQKVKKDTAVAHLEKLAADLEKQINSKNWSRPITDKSPAPRTAALRETIKILQSIKERTQKLDPNWVASYEAKLDEALTKASDARTAKWEQRLRDNDFTVEVKVPRKLSDELAASRFAEAKAKTAFLKRKETARVANLKGFAWFKHRASQTLYFRNQYALLGDAGAVLRANGIFTLNSLLDASLTLAGQRRLARVFWKTLKSLTPAKEFEIYNAMVERPNAVYDKVKIKGVSMEMKYLAPDEEGFRNNEDSLDPELLNKMAEWRYGTNIPARIILKVERFNRIFSNLARAETLDMLIASHWGENPNEQSVATYINAAMMVSGRGFTPNQKRDAYFAVANEGVISSRWYYSRAAITLFQPLWTTRTNWNETKKARAVILYQVYGKMVARNAALMGLAVMLGLGKDDDDDEGLELNPTSDDWMNFFYKLKNGKVITVDVSGGLRPFVNLISRGFTGKKLVGDSYLDLSQRKYGTQTPRQTFWSFVDHRLKANTNFVLSLLDRHFYGDIPVTPLSTAKELITNATVSEMYKIGKTSEGQYEAQAALSALSFVGASVKTPFPKKPTSSSSSKGIKKLVIKPLSKQK